MSNQLQAEIYGPRDGSEAADSGNHEALAQTLDEYRTLLKYLLKTLNAARPAEDQSPHAVLHVIH